MTEERRLVADRLADAISGERREWFRVEVSPDDLAKLLAALPQPATEPALDDCPCGHDDNEHVHYCSADVERGICNCNEEYVRLATEPALDDPTRPTWKQIRAQLEAVRTCLRPGGAEAGRPPSAALDILSTALANLDWWVAAQPSAEVERLRAIADIIDTYEVGYGSTHGLSSAEAVAMIADALAGSGLGDDHAA